MRLLAVVIGVNLFSWLVGVLFSLILPSGLVPELVDAPAPAYILTQGPHWNAIAIVSFFEAYLLNFGLEYGGLRFMCKCIPFQRLGLCVGVANVASYCVIAVVVAVHLHFDLF